MKKEYTRWGIIATIFAATTINYIDRQALSVAAPVIREELEISNQQYGWIVSMFLFAYAFMQVVWGGVVDRIGPKKGFSIAVVWWSVASILHAFGQGFKSFAGFRFLLGMGEAGNYPAAIKSISEWFPEEERTKAVGILNMGPGMGAIIAPPLMAWLILSFGWRIAFVVTGLIGFVWLALWLRVYRTPEVSKAGKVEEDKTPWHHYFRLKEVWGIALSRFVSDGAFYFFVFWLPSYLMDTKGFNLVQIGLFAWIPFFASDIGSFSGGWTSGKLMDKGFSLNAARKIVIWIGAFLVTPVIFCLYVDDPYVALALISLALFSTQFKQASLFTLPIDLFPGRASSTVWGLSGSAGSFGAMLFTPFVGWMIDQWSYESVFIIVVLMHIASASIISLMVPNIKQLERTD